MRILFGQSLKREGTLLLGIPSKSTLIERTPPDKCKSKLRTGASLGVWTRTKIDYRTLRNSFGAFQASCKKTCLGTERLMLSQQGLIVCVLLFCSVLFCSAILDVIRV